LGRASKSEILVNGNLRQERWAFEFAGELELGFDGVEIWALISIIAWLLKLFY
jgi:hypothetical protein